MYCICICSPLNVELNYYKYMEQAFMDPNDGINIAMKLCLLAEPGMWSLERFLMYHFYHTL